MAKSYPWWKLWFEDLDRDCGALSLASRGAWVWILGNIRNLGGERSLDIEGWARLIGASPSQTVMVLTELINAGICDAKLTCNANVTELSHTSVTQLSQASNAIVTIINRRISREYKQRTANSLRQQRIRAKRKSNAKVTDVSHYKEAEAEALPSCVPRCVTQNNNGNGNGSLSAKDFWLILWESYPAHRRGDQEGKDSAFTEFLNLKPDKQTLSQMLAAIDLSKQSEKWQEKEGKYVPNIKRWLNSKAWEGVEVPVICQTCERIGVVVREGDRILPWSLQREVGQELKPEVCPECHGKNRINVPGLPNVRFS
jgi:hypothetical protein